MAESSVVKDQIVILAFVEAEEYMTAHAVLMDPVSRVLCLIAVCGMDVETIDKTVTGAVDCPDCVAMLRGMF